MTDRRKTVRPAPATSPNMQKSSKRQLVAFVRLILGSPRQIAGQGQGQGRGQGQGQAQDALRLAGADTRIWPQALVDEALSLGLVEIDGGMIRASAEARSFLRRALSEVEDGFIAQHGEIAAGVAEIDGARHPVRRNLDDSPLSSVARLKDRDGRPYMSDEAIGAGERLAADFTRGQLQPRITASWEPRLSARSRGAGGIPAGGHDIADSAIAARKRFGEAVDALGPELSGVAMDVCCFAKGLELIERERQWPARSAKLMLRAALLSLARHYAPPPERPTRRTHRWGDTDYRPKIG